MAYKSTLNFTSYKKISKKHLKIILPENDGHNSKKGMYAALRSKPKSKSAIIDYLDKGSKLELLETVGAYALVKTESEQIGYVNISCLDTVKTSDVAIAQTSGLNNSETNLLLIAYAKCDAFGAFKVDSMNQLAKDAQVDRSTLYRAMAKLENLGVFHFSKDTRVISILDIDKIYVHGYAEVNTRFMTKKFLSLPIDCKRLALYLVHLQASSGIKVSFKKLMRVSRKNSVFKLMDALRDIKSYFTFFRHKGFFVFHVFNQSQTIKSAISSLGFIYEKTMQLIGQSILGEVDLSEEDRYLIARSYGKYSPPEQLFKEILDSAGKQYLSIRTTLPKYITGAIMKYQLPTTAI